MIKNILTIFLLTFTLQSYTQHSIEVKAGIGMTPYIQSHPSIQWYQFSTQSRELVNKLGGIYHFQLSKFWSIGTSASLRTIYWKNSKIAYEDGGGNSSGSNVGEYHFESRVISLGLTQLLDITFQLKKFNFSLRPGVSYFQKYQTKTVYTYHSYTTQEHTEPFTNQYNNTASIKPDKIWRLELGIGYQISSKFKLSSEFFYIPSANSNSPLKFTQIFLSLGYRVWNKGPIK